MEYYYGNLVAIIVISKACTKYGVEKFIFSLLATVYGDNEVPFVETMKLMPPPIHMEKLMHIKERIFVNKVKVNLDWVVEPFPKHC